MQNIKLEHKRQHGWHIQVRGIGYCSLKHVRQEDCFRMSCTDMIVLKYHERGRRKYEEDIFPWTVCRFLMQLIQPNQILNDKMKRVQVKVSASLPPFIAHAAAS